MRKFLVAVCLMIGIVSLGYAQSKVASTPAEKAKELQGKLHLTNHQTEKIAAVYDESAHKYEKIKAEEHGDNNKMAIKLAPVRRETIKKIKEVLTPSQGVKFDKLIKHSADNGEGWSNGWAANS
jgi:periplasmic protein CpxP/Spy